ncbi:MAG: hypothetical protein LBG73_01175 [Spirochaetaceae bacterium]|nr:hypothetical protein [Spirochaetaceae bacterium]
MEVRTLFAKAVENWPAKVLSIALALVLFVIHRMSILEERTFSAPLRIELEPNIAAASLYPRMVQVTVRGDAENIRALTEDSIEPYIDLRGKGRGKYRTPIHFQKKGAAQSIEPLEIRVEPLEISLTLDAKASKTVPVKPDIRGTVKHGYELVGFTLNPNQAVIEGPSDLIAPVSELSTVPIDLADRDEDFTLMSAIAEPNPLVSIRGTPMTGFQGSIREIMGLENFNGLPIVIEGLSAQFSADADSKTGMVRIRGNRQELEAFHPSEDFLSVDCSGITQPGTYTLPVSARIPAGFTLIRQGPETVSIRIAPKRPL